MCNLFIITQPNDRDQPANIDVGLFWGQTSKHSLHSGLDAVMEAVVAEEAAPATEQAHHVCARSSTLTDGAVPIPDWSQLHHPFRT
eukprot:m.460254 g.460254  ORF g.460254 m.460254 type:complete len:86 (-) comp21978_c0_seq1:5491-5748(-)